MVCEQMLEEGMQITLMTKTMRDFMGLDDVDDGMSITILFSTDGGRRFSVELVALLSLAYLVPKTPPGL
jgi:hypothetical protein